jgi:hypothetical protein
MHASSLCSFSWAHRAHRGSGPWENPKIIVYIEFSEGSTRVFIDAQIKATGINKQSKDNK